MSRGFEVMGTRRAPFAFKSITMKRAAIAAAWIVGATVPLLMAVTFVFGCCVLPFHGVIHKVLPLCDMAIGLIHGTQHEPQSAPAQQKQEPVKRIATTLPRSISLGVTQAIVHNTTTLAITSFRSFITLGAIRCDRDVGLHLLTGTLLI
jgi:hypothetical protein